MPRHMKSLSLPSPMTFLSGIFPILLAAVLLLLPETAHSAAPAFLMREVIPSTTDPQIITTNYNQPQIVVLATNPPPLGKLLLHL